MIAWVAALALGAIHAWATRHQMLSDGIAYLDIAEAYWRGDWKAALNAYWSPMYSWLIALVWTVAGHSPRWEFASAHLANFVAYAAALGSFEFLLREILRGQQARAAAANRDAQAALPIWALAALGYAVFMWTSFELVTMASTTPDMLLLCFLYLAAGCLLRIRREPGKWLPFILLGAAIGCAYLTKSAFFALAFVFWGLSAAAVGRWRKALPRVLISVLAFAVVGGPFIMALSKSAGRLTFGEAGRLNYLWYVTRMAATGTPVNQPRRLMEKPVVEAFGDAVPGTFPLQDDPSHWLAGLTPRFSLRSQVRAIGEGGLIYFYLFFESQAALVAGCLILYLAVGNLRQALRQIGGQWPLLLTTVAGLGLYLLVKVELRYLAGFVALLWLGLFSGVRIARCGGAERFIASVCVAMLAILAILIGASTGRYLVRGQRAAAHVQWQVAETIGRMGVRPGDAVACLGNGGDAHWARLARVRIAAQIPDDSVEDFWLASDAVRDRALKALAGVGCRVIVTSRYVNRSPADGWQPLGGTHYHARMLDR